MLTAKTGARPRVWPLQMGVSGTARRSPRHSKPATIAATISAAAVGIELRPDCSLRQLDAAGAGA